MELARIDPVTLLVNEPPAIGRDRGRRIGRGRDLNIASAPRAEPIPTAKPSVGRGRVDPTPPAQPTIKAQPIPPG